MIQTIKTDNNINQIKKNKKTKNKKIIREINKKRYFKNRINYN